MKTITKSILITIAILMSNLNYGAHLVVPVSVCYLVGTSAPYNTLQGGDTLFFTTGTKTDICMISFTGSPSAPIVCINQGGVVTLGRGYTYGIKIGGCRYIKFTGTGTSDKYGFHVTAPAGDGVAIGDLSSDIEVCNILMDTCGLRGVSAKTDPGCNGYASRTNFTQYNTIIHDCLINNPTYEGMYIGNSFWQLGETVLCNGVDSALLPSNLVNAQVYNNILNHCGYDGIQLACCISGMSIHNNIIRWDSKTHTYGQSDGILIGGGSVGDCYDNYIEYGNGTGINYFGQGAGSRIFNNIIINEGSSGSSEDGIYTNDNTFLSGTELDIMFNTIINPAHYGIDFESYRATASVIADNCIINTSGNYIKDGGAVITVTNNYTNTSATPAMFKDTTYALLAGSPLIDAGWSNGKGITADKFGDLRPQGITYDIGVYEASGITTYPTVTSDTATIITQTSAESGGDVTSIGGTAVTARGACWNTTPNPIATGNHTSDGTGLGLFVSNITGLTSGILYHVRAYATNSSGTSYGNDDTFTTLTLLTVTTDTVTNITQTTATSGGIVTSIGGTAVTARGVCWNTSASPTIVNSKTSDGTGTGAFVSNITGMTTGTLYYIRAYATNVNGTAYGNQRSFTTSEQSVLAIVTTNTVTNIESTTATCGGNVI
ncbi:MAG: right-handed parallel beta-helix repeat-containing protein, partial [Bacteroidales bacterium]